MRAPITPSSIVGLSLAVALAGLATPACRSTTAEAATDSGPLAGRVSLDGSSTLHPVSVAMANAFHAANGNVDVAVATSGTAGGFKKLCTGAIDVAEASRPITTDESRECQNHGVEFIELPVAFDSLTVVADAHNTFLSCLTVPELKQIWEPAAEGKVMRWNQVRASFPAEPMALYGPGTDSGTFDYFTEAINGKQDQSRSDYTQSEDDNALVTGVAGDKAALGYFGFAYLEENLDKIKPVQVDGGSGCVDPSADNVNSGKYKPLARPLFIYPSKTALDRPEFAAFVQYYLANVNTFVDETGYIQALPDVLAKSKSDLADALK